MTINDSQFCKCLTFLGQLSAADQSVALSRPKAAGLIAAKWQPGAVITIRFLDGDPGLQARVRAVAMEWTKIANLTFDFRASGETDIRISFSHDRGSWSYIGTQCTGIAQTEPTMNYGWLTPESTEDELRRVVLHEFGHAIGMLHEHQSPKGGGIDWNRDAVIRDLSGPPNNWDSQTIDENMFKKYEPGAVAGTEVDPLSIMMYPIPLSWTNDGTQAGLNSELSNKDRDFIAEWYNG